MIINHEKANLIYIYIYIYSFAFGIHLLVVHSCYLELGCFVS